LKIGFNPRSGSELQELDAVDLAAQVDVLQVLLTVFIVSFDEDTMPDALLETLNTMNVTATVVPDGYVDLGDVVEVKDRYLNGIAKTLDRIREMVGDNRPTS